MANLNEVKKHHYIYKTTNIKSGKYYIGMHSTNKLDDDYLGSGKRLRYSIRKNGKENFKIEILEWYDNRIDLTNRETQLVNENLLKDPMCMNLKPGGVGGFSLEATKNGRKKTDLFLKEKYGDDFRSIVSKNFYENLTIEKRNELTKKIKDGQLKSNFIWGSTWLGKFHTKETKMKIGKINSVKQSGSSNSQFGTCWITNGIENKKIKKTEKLPKGWELGRK
jgi:hypothetical protein